MSSEELIASLQQRIKVLEDKDTIAALLNNYCTSADKHEWDSFAACFLEDGVMEYEGWGPVVGREKIKKIASDAETRFEGLQHSFTNFQFEVDASDQATGTCYLWFCATPKVNNPEQNYAFGGAYSWNFKRTDKGWKIQKMNLKRLWSQGEDTERQWT